MNWTYLLISYLSLIGLGLADNIRGPVYPELLSQFQLTNSIGSLFFSLTGVFGMFNNLFASHWLKWWGPVGALRVYSGVLFAGVITLGFASRIEMVWIGVSLMGASFGGLAVSQNPLVLHGSTIQRRTQALSGLHTMYALASLLAPITVSISYLFGWPWNSMFLFAGTIPFLVLVWSFISVPAQLKFDEPLLHHHSEPSTNVSRRALLWVATFTTCYVMTELLVSSRLVLYVRALENFTPKQANDLLGGFFIAMVAGRLLLTVKRVPVKNSSLLKSSLAGALVTILLAIYHHPYWFVGVGLAMSISFPCMIAYASETFGQHTARVMSWIFTGNYVGLIAMHGVVGVIADTLGLRQALLLGPFFLGAGLILLSLPPSLPAAETTSFPR